MAANGWHTVAEHRETAQLTFARLDCIHPAEGWIDRRIYSHHFRRLVLAIR
jgi:hypothetical protein